MTLTKLTFLLAYPFQSHQFCAPFINLLLVLDIFIDLPNFSQFFVHFTSLHAPIHLPLDVESKCMK